MAINEHNYFQELVQAHHAGALAEYAAKALSVSSKPKEMANRLSALCGVEVSYGDNFPRRLVEAVNRQERVEKVLSRVKDCQLACVGGDKSKQTKCQTSCPLDAILVNSGTMITQMDENKCIGCGSCVGACPISALQDKIEYLPLVKLLQGDHQVIAAVAPSIMGQFGERVKIDQLRTAFKKMGFVDMVEVAFFADMLTLKEAVDFDEFVHTEDDFMLASCCCPIWIGMLKGVYHDLVKHVGPSVSPMIASGRVTKKLNPQSKVVFIGPCIAKKGEIKNQDLVGDIDFVLTFAEVKDIFQVLGIVPEELEEDTSSEYASREGILYARTAGVSTAVREAIARMYPEKAKMIKSAQAEGVQGCKEMLEKLQKGEIEANYIEGMGCVGGCVGGPKTLIPAEKGRETVDTFADCADIKISLNSPPMREVLERLGIDHPDDFKDKQKALIFGRSFN